MQQQRHSIFTIFKTQILPMHSLKPCISRCDDYSQGCFWPNFNTILCRISLFEEPSIYREFLFVRCTAETVIFLGHLNSSFLFFNQMTHIAFVQSSKGNALKCCLLRSVCTACSQPLVKLGCLSLLTTNGKVGVLAVCNFLQQGFVLEDTLAHCTLSWPLAPLKLYCSLLHLGTF